MSFGRTPQLADDSYRNLTVSETLAVKGRLTAGTFDADNVLVDRLTVNGNVLVGGTIAILGGISSVSGGNIIVPNVTDGSLVVGDTTNNQLVVTAPLVPTTAGALVPNFFLPLNINGSIFNILLQQ